MRDTLRDTRVWMVGFFLIPTFDAAYSYGFTAPLLIKDLTGYSNTRVGLIIACISLCAAFAILFSGKLASSSRSPFAYIGVATVLIMLGCIGVGLLRAAPLAVCCMILISACHNTNMSPLWALTGSFLKDSVSQTRNFPLSGCFRSAACRAAFVRTMACPLLLPTPCSSSPGSRSGGYAWASPSNASGPGTRSRTAAMNACISR